MEWTSEADDIWARMAADEPIVDGRRRRRPPHRRPRRRPRRVELGHARPATPTESPTPRPRPGVDPFTADDISSRAAMADRPTELPDPSALLAARGAAVTRRSRSGDPAAAPVGPAPGSARRPRRRPRTGGPPGGGGRGTPHLAARRRRPPSARRAARRAADRPPATPPRGTARRAPRRHRRGEPRGVPGRAVVRRRAAVTVALVLVLLLAWPIGLLVWANGKIQHVDALSGSADTTPAPPTCSPGRTRAAAPTGIPQDGTVGQRSDTIMLLHDPPSRPDGADQPAARHLRRHPRPRPGQAQRRLRVRRSGAAGRDRGAAHRHARRPLRRGRARRRLARGQRRRRRPAVLRPRGRQGRLPDQRQGLGAEVGRARVQDGRRHDRRGVLAHAQGRPRGRHRPRAPPARAHLRGLAQGLGRVAACAARPSGRAARRGPRRAPGRQGHANIVDLGTPRARVPRRDRARTGCAARRRSPTRTTGPAASARPCCSTRTPRRRSGPASRTGRWSPARWAVWADPAAPHGCRRPRIGASETPLDRASHRTVQGLLDPAVHREREQHAEPRRRARASRSAAGARPRRRSPTGPRTGGPGTAGTSAPRPPSARASPSGAPGSA